jgi:glycosyltransferase involved in cell wall biosynthesis
MFQLSTVPGERSEPLQGPGARGENLSELSPVRVAVVCDFLEEHWPSMDLVGDMLTSHLTAGHSGEMSVTQLRPGLRRRLTRLPGLSEQTARNADRLVNRFADYPVWLRGQREQFDLFHLVDHSYSQLIHGLPAGRTVVTCHDLDTFRCLLEPDRETRPRWFRAMARRILEGFRQAAHVLAVSEATRDDLLRNRLFPREKVSVVHNGAHPSCSPIPNPAADAVAADLLPDGDETVWLLNVGSTLPRKRLDVLLRVFAAVRQKIPKARLVRVGGGFLPEHLQLAAELGLGSALLTLPFLERDILAAIYRRAAVLLHTAEAEGFGLPLVEAMACGCPVIASDVAALREVGGEAATYCRVGDVDIWTENVARLLLERAHQSRAWECRRLDAIDQARRFSWVENARQTACIYRKVLAAC